MVFVLTVIEILNMANEGNVYRESLTDAQIQGLAVPYKIDWQEVSFVKANRVGEVITIKLFPKDKREFTRVIISSGL